MDSTKSGTYFQFPIGALMLNCAINKVTPEQAQERLSQVVDYCVWNMGNHIHETEEPGQQAAICERLSCHEDLETQIAAMGADRLRVTYSGGLEAGGGGRIKHRHKKVEAMAKSGQNMFVRIRNDFFWEAYRNEMSWREFSILCAIYSAIGSYRRTKLTYDRIGAMALGFNGQRERDKQKAKKHQFSDRQIQYTVKALESRGLFVSASPNRRHVFYSHSMSLSKLIEDLAVHGAEKKKVSAVSKTELIRKRTAELAKQ